LQDIYEFFSDVEALYTDIRKFPVPALKGLVKARGSVRKLLTKRRSAGAGERESAKGR